MDPLSNSSNLTKATRYVHDEPYHSSYLFFIIIAAVFLANLLTILSFRRDGKFQRMFYFIIVSFSVKDILNALLIMPVTLFQKVFGDFPFSTALCYSWLILDTVLQASAFVHICVLAYNTQKALVHPLTYHMQQKARHVLLQYSIIWLCALVLSVPLIGMVIMSMNDRSDTVLYFSECTTQMSPENPMNFISRYIPAYIFPLMLALSLCAWAGIETHRHKRILTRICTIVEQNGVICNGTQILRNSNIIQAAIERFKTQPLLVNNVEKEKEIAGDIDSEELSTYNETCSEPATPVGDKEMPDIDAESVCRSISSSSSYSTLPQDGNAPKDGNDEPQESGSDDGLTMLIDKNQNGAEDTVSQKDENGKDDSDNTCENKAESESYSDGDYQERKEPNTKEVVKDDQSDHESTKSGRESLNEPVLDEDIDLIIGPDCNSDPQNGVDNPAFKANDEVSLADAIKVHSPSVKSTVEEQKPMERDASGDSLVAVDPNDPECKLRPGRRSILKRDRDRNRSLRKSVKFASDVNETNKPKRLVRKGTKHVKVTHNKKMNGHSSFSRLSLQGNGNLNIAPDSSSSLEYLSHVHTQQGKRATNRLQSEESRFTLLCIIFMLYTLLTMPLVIAMGFYCLNNDHEFLSNSPLLSVLQWLSYSSAIVVPVLLFVMSNKFRHHCVATCCCIPPKYSDIKSMTESRLVPQAKNGSIVMDNEVIENHQEKELKTNETHITENGSTPHKDKVEDTTTAVVHSESMNDLYYECENGQVPNGNVEGIKQTQDESNIENINTCEADNENLIQDTESKVLRDNDLDIINDIVSSENKRNDG